MANQRSIQGKKVLGIEFGSTRIKAVLIDDRFEPLVSGSHEWENKLVDGFWTYSIDDVWSGLQDAYSQLAEEYKRSFGEPLKQIDAIGFSGMMHGYLAYDKHGKLLTPFRTWRNTTTAQAAEELT